MAYIVWPVLDVLMIVAGIFIGRSLAARLRPDQKKIISGIGLLVGIGFIIYGILSLMFAIPEKMGQFDLPNVGGMAAVGVGGGAAMAAIVMIISKVRQSGFTFER